MTKNLLQHTVVKTLSRY